eukprot:c16157_g1_i1.p1 GENE.c16157_g1_i1~~c16157_g1_i1.p1  ORF type:complete len:286 (-),score=114.66 c16157_g1_i1:50-907(-)
MSSAYIFSLAKYRISEPGSIVFNRIVHGCRTILRTHGVLTLDSFVTDVCVIRMAREAQAKATTAWTFKTGHTPFSRAYVPTLPQNHIRNKFLETKMSRIGCDELPQNGLIRLVYEYEPFVEFIRAVTEQETLYKISDPFAAVTVDVLKNGQSQSWRYENNPYNRYKVMLMIQKPTEGGIFQYSTPLHIDSPLVEQHTEKVINEEKKEEEGGTIRQLRFEPGMLCIIDTHRCLHRITTVVGEKDRLVTEYAFSNNKGTKCSREKLLELFGRDSPRPTPYDRSDVMF